MVQMRQQLWVHQEDGLYSFQFVLSIPDDLGLSRLFKQVMTYSPDVATLPSE